jgi:hypothetical protein
VGLPFAQHTRMRFQMKPNGYTRVSWTESGVFLSSTDAHVMDWVLDDVKNFLPTATLFKNWRGVLPSGETYTYTIQKLQGRDGDVAWWVVKQLCRQGWEPFAVEGNTIHLRFRDPSAGWNP